MPNYHNPFQIFRYVCPLDPPLTSAVPKKNIETLLLSVGQLVLQYKPVGFPQGFNSSAASTSTKCYSETDQRVFGTQRRKRK